MRRKLREILCKGFDTNHWARLVSHGWMDGEYLMDFSCWKMLLLLESRRCGQRTVVMTQTGNLTVKCLCRALQ